MPPRPLAPLAPLAPSPPLLQTTSNMAASIARSTAEACSAPFDEEVASPRHADREVRGGGLPWG